MLERYVIKEGLVKIPHCIDGTLIDIYGNIYRPNLIKCYKVDKYHNRIINIEINFNIAWVKVSLLVYLTFKNPYSIPVHQLSNIEIMYFDSKNKCALHHNTTPSTVSFKIKTDTVYNGVKYELCS